MKSWITFLLPADEYKQNRILFFYAEGAIIQLLALIAVMISYNFFHIDIGIGLFISLSIFPLYVTARYILSGMEYADVATKQAYRKELKFILIRGLMFIGLFTVLYITWSGVPRHTAEWLNVSGLLVSISFVWFTISFLSLKRSYNKNKDLV